MSTITSNFTSVLGVGYVAKSLNELLGPKFNIIPRINKFAKAQSEYAKKYSQGGWIRSINDFAPSGEDLGDFPIYYDDFVRPKRCFILKSKDENNFDYVMSHVINGIIARHLLNDLASETFLI